MWVNVSQSVWSMMGYGVPTQEPWKIKVHIEMELKFMGLTQVLRLGPGNRSVHRVNERFIQSTGLKNLSKEPLKHIETTK